MPFAAAPSCPVSQDQVIPVPKQQMIPPIRRASNDLDSVQATANQTKDVLDQVLHNDNQPEWVEIQRNSQQVRIHNPDNYDQWIEVQRITKVVFKNKLTDARIEWNYKHL